MASALLLTLVLVLPSLALAAPPGAPLPSMAAAHDVQSGQLLYREQRLSVHDGQAVQAQTVRYFDADGAPMGLKSLGFGFSLRQPELEFTSPGDAPWYLLRSESQGWVLQSKGIEPRSERNRWVRLRPDVLVDDALLHYLVSNREALIEEEVDAIWWARLPDLSARKYRLHISSYRTGAVDLLRFELFRSAGFFAGEELSLRLDVRRDDGRWLRYQGPSTHPLVSSETVVMEFKY